MNTNWLQRRKGDKMTKIYLEDSILKNYVSEGLEKAITSLNEAKNIAKFLNIPYNFYYSTTLKNLDDDIDDYLQILNYTKSIVKNQPKMYSNVNKNINADIRAIENYNINLRHTTIK